MALRSLLADHRIREGYRIVGRYQLRADDLRAGREFDDAVARGVFYLDGHKPDDDKRTYILPKEELYVPPYQIPFRCLVARDGRNLLMAGRCMSADQLALSSARVTTTCSMLGQAAGIGAAMAVARGADAADLDPVEVRRELNAAAPTSPSTSHRRRRSARADLPRGRKRPRRSPGPGRPATQAPCRRAGRTADSVDRAGPAP